MKQNILRLFAVMVVFGLLLTACNPVATEIPVVPPTEASPHCPNRSCSSGTYRSSTSASNRGSSCYNTKLWNRSCRAQSNYFETGFDIPFKLAEEFTKQYPNVTWDIKQDQFANLITRPHSCFLE